MSKLDDLPWGDIVKTAKKNNYRGLSLDIFQFALEEDNRTELVKSALKSLEKTDSGSATIEKAESLADMMQIFAKMVVEESERSK